MVYTDVNATAAGRKMFKELLSQLEEIHLSGHVYGEMTYTDFVKDENGKWRITMNKPLYKIGTLVNTENEYIGWKKHNRAPEFRNACLQGIDYHLTVSGDIYSFAYSIYEAITGHQPRLNFQLDRHWASTLEDSFGCDTERKKQALQRLLDRCTQVSVYHRIQSCQQLKNSEEYGVLFPDGQNK